MITSGDLLGDLRVEHTLIASGLALFFGYLMWVTGKDAREAQQPQKWHLWCISGGCGCAAVAAGVAGFWGEILRALSL